MHPRPLKQFRALSHILGRREALKYTGIAIAAGMVAPLTGCSGSKVAFAEFAAGTWTVTIPKDTGLDWNEASLLIEKNGGWTLSPTPRVPHRSASGTWKLENVKLILTVQVAGNDYSIVAARSDDTYAAASIPQEIDKENMPSAFMWELPSDGEDEGGGDSIDFSVAWDAETKALTLTPQAGGAWTPPPDDASWEIVAKKSED